MSQNIKGSSPWGGRAGWLDMADLEERECTVCDLEILTGFSRRERRLLWDADHFLRLARRHTDTPDIAAACPKYADLLERLGEGARL
jgi:hypothetical protein